MRCKPSVVLRYSSSLTIEQAEAEVVPRSNLVEVAVDVDVGVEDGV